MIIRSPLFKKYRTIFDITNDLNRVNFLYIVIFLPVDHEYGRYEITIVARSAMM